ncbi:MAG: oxygen-independent coproporphyrinogen III oxidase [Bacteroidetes bacterium]|nr:MAG: oxygen-independent coproporphyrinogen III oxidase [Bacteroidota bacterium]
MDGEVVNSMLIRKYNRPVPRYTSYPTVPFWKDQLDDQTWISILKKKFAEQDQVGLSLYIHLPFCESLCTYCGCNKKITTNHSVEEEYLEAIEKEWLTYRKIMNQTPFIKEIHLGGGTPTFFSPNNLQRLLVFILKDVKISPHHEFSIEGHPNNTTLQHLEMLHSMGFRRISYGVQDLDPTVQRVINRIQPFENLKSCTENARKVGFSSVNYDLIYGLPLQTVETMEATINKVLLLKPDRIAFYSYAHVPWTSKAQRLFDESDLPDPEAKLQLYLKGKELLSQNGYADIGMDHFALPSDNLFAARKEGRLHRNFMGYTSQNAGHLLGLGVSAISDMGEGFAQNKKALHDYYSAVNAGSLAIQKGYVLTTQDSSFRKYILDISCKGETQFYEGDIPTLKSQVFPRLSELELDGLIEWNDQGVKLTSQGHYFIRNVCSAFDLYLNRSEAEMKVFSKAI